MGAWQYAFFFPGPHRPLDAGNAVRSLVSNGFELSSRARRLVPIDAEGHLGEFGDEILLEEPFMNDLQQRLRQGEQLFIEITKDDIANNGTDTVVTAFACSFALKTSNPNFSFGWHQRLFSRLSQQTQHEYWQLIRDAAKAAFAVYVVLVNEGSDTFEDRFIEVDGKRVLDTQVHHQWGHGIRAVWVDRSAGANRPDGVAETTIADLGNGFVQYSVD